MSSKSLSWFTLSLFLACGTPPPSPNALAVRDGELTRGNSTMADAIVDVEQTPVKRQSIGNCWLYATATWAESLHKTATGEEANLSESYWTYWHWFDQISDSWGGSDHIQTGGSFWVAREIIRSYGYMNEADFIASEANIEMSARQSSALAAINLSLKSGVLRDSDSRRDRALVRQELDKAWGLTPAVSAAITQAFGADVSKDMRNTLSLSGTGIHRPSELDIAVATPSDVQGKPTLNTQTLLQALDQWQEENYPSWSASSQRAFLKRIQRAMHDRQPLIVSWFVDFNALDNEGRFAAPPSSPGRQGGHMVVVEDYRINDVPGYGTLAANTLVTDPVVLDAALASSAKIEFFRIKNSWGGARLDRNFVPGFPGYHDLYMDYLNGPVKRCNQTPAGETNTNDCPFDYVPFQDVVFPAGY